MKKVTVYKYFKTPLDYQGKYYSYEFRDLYPYERVGEMLEITIEVPNNVRVASDHDDPTGNGGIGTFERGVLLEDDAPFDVDDEIKIVGEDETYIYGKSERNEYRFRIIK